MLPVWAICRSLTIRSIRVVAAETDVLFLPVIGVMTDIEGVPQWWVQLLLPVGAAVLLVVALTQALLLALGREPKEQVESEAEAVVREAMIRGE